MSQYAAKQVSFSGAKRFSLLLFLIGAVLTLISYFVEGDQYDHAIFWTNILHNVFFFTGIAFAALFFICTHTLAWGGWHVLFKRIPEAMSLFLPIGGLLLGIIFIAMIFGGFSDYIYIWNLDFVVEHDHLVNHKSSFLNLKVFGLTLLVIALWTVFAYGMRRLSVKQDSTPEQKRQILKSLRTYSAVFLPVAGFSSAYVIWQWIMSIDAHWYSTLFAWYATTSLWVAAVALILMIAIYLRNKGVLTQFNREHLHDIGKYIFGFSVFWTYLWFSQFLLIWYANNGEETQYFDLRIAEYAPIFILNLVINFVLPFFILMMNSSKRAFGTVAFVAGLVFFGHWLDFYQMIKPGVWYNKEHVSHLKHEHGSAEDSHEDKHHGSVYHMNDDAPKAVFIAQESDGHEADTESHHEGEASHGDHGHSHSQDGIIMGVHFPGIFELGGLALFLGLFLFITFNALGGAAVIPVNDPFLDESVHHATGVYIDTEETLEGDHH